MTAEEVFDVARRTTGEFANRVVRNAVDGVPFQFIDAEQQDQRRYDRGDRNGPQQLDPRTQNGARRPQLKVVK